MAMKLEDIIFEGLARICNEPPPEQAVVSAEHPPISILERSATRGQWNLKYLLHTNTCIGCRRTIRLLHQELDIKPWWQELSEAAQQAIKILMTPPQVVGAKTRAQLSAPAVVLLSGRKPERIVIEVMAVRLTPDKKSVRMTVRLQHPIDAIREVPIELTIVTREGQPMESFLLPRLSAGRQEEFKLMLPPALQESWQGVDEMDELPFGFILRPCFGGVDVESAT